MRLFAWMAALAAMAAAQNGSPAFEVTSVKPSEPGRSGYSINSNKGGAFTTNNTTLRNLITFAYDIRDFQLTGGPKWIESDHYDIVAHPPQGLTLPEKPEERSDLTRKRVQALLAERFQLVVHMETKELPVYALVIGKNGPTLKPADPANENRGISRNERKMTCTGISMKDFAERALAPQLGNMVLDKTELSGLFTFELQYAEESLSKPGVQPADKQEAADPLGPSLAVALQEQLGLKLETQKAPVQVVVVDRAEKASAN